MESRAAHQSVHRRRNRRLNAAARNATSQAGRIIKQTRALCASSRPPRPTSDVRSVLFAARLSPCEIKLCQKDEKFIPHFRRTELFPSGGGVPKGRRGNNTPMSGDYTLTRRKGVSNTSMSKDGTLSRMGLPAKSPQAILWGPRKEGGIKITHGTNTPSEHLRTRRTVFYPVPICFGATPPAGESKTSRACGLTCKLVQNKGFIARK